MKPSRILVFENDMTNRELFDFMLTDEGYEVLVSNYDVAALKLVQTFEPNLIVLDLIAVQRDSGWAFLQLLKMEEHTSAIPILICTTSTRLSREIEGYLAARHISIVRKPFDLGTFLELVSRTLGPDHFTESPLSRFLPILIVEDDNNLREVATTILRLEGYQVDDVVNGLLALEAVTEGKYSVILLDLYMPIMNGEEFLAAYELQVGQHSPVIIISGQRDLKLESLSRLVTDIIIKPFEIEKLLALVAKYSQPITGDSERT